MYMYDFVISSSLLLTEHSSTAM